MMSWLESVDYPGLGIAFLILIILTLWVGNKALPHLDNEEKIPYWHPMLAFVFAGSVDEAQEVLDATQAADQKAIEKFKIALGWDYLFIFIYPLCAVVGCLLTVKFLAANNLSGETIGIVLIALLPLSALLDAIENYAVLRLLRGPMESPWPQLAKWCAIPKFTIVLAALFYVLFGGLMWIVTRFKG